MELANECISKKADNGIILKFKPLARNVSLFSADNKTFKRKEFDEFKLDFPVRAVVDIGSSCNFNCKYCSYGSNKKNNERISKEKIFQIIDELEKMKVFELSLRGG